MRKLERGTENTAETSPGLLLLLNSKLWGIVANTGVTDRKCLDKMGGKVPMILMWFGWMPSSSCVSLRAVAMSSAS